MGPVACAGCAIGAGGSTGDYLTLYFRMWSSQSELDIDGPTNTIEQYKIQDFDKITCGLDGVDALATGAGISLEATKVDWASKCSFDSCSCGSTADCLSAGPGQYYGTCRCLKSGSYSSNKCGRYTRLAARSARTRASSNTLDSFIGGCSG